MDRKAAFLGRVSIIMWTTDLRGVTDEELGTSQRTGWHEPHRQKRLVSLQPRTITSCSTSYI